MKDLKNKKAVSSANEETLTRGEAMSKIGTYGKYAALTAVGMYIFLSPKAAQARSADNPGDNF